MKRWAYQIEDKVTLTATRTIILIYENDIIVIYENDRLATLKIYNFILHLIKNNVFEC